MKQTLVVAFALVLLQLPRGDAVFGNVFPNNGGDPNAFDLTNVLECADDRGERLVVPLVRPGSGSDHEYWLPAKAE